MGTNLSSLRADIAQYTPMSGAFDTRIKKLARTNIFPRLNIALVGLAGAGKSCLINNIATALAGEPSHVAHEFSFDTDGTQHLTGFFDQTHKFKIFDTRGAVEASVILGIVEGRVLEGDTIPRYENHIQRRQPAPLQDQMHSVIFVFDGKDPRSLEDYKGAMEIVRQKGISPVLVFTKSKSVTAPDRNILLQRVGSVTRTANGSYFFLENWPEQKLHKMKDSHACQLLDVVRAALSNGERYLDLLHTRRVWRDEPVPARLPVMQQPQPQNVVVALPEPPVQQPPAPLFVEAQVVPPIAVAVQPQSQPPLHPPVAVPVQAAVAPLPPPPLALQAPQPALSASSSASGASLAAAAAAAAAASAAAASESEVLDPQHYGALATPRVAYMRERAAVGAVVVPAGSSSSVSLSSSSVVAAVPPVVAAQQPPVAIKVAAPTPAIIGPPDMSARYISVPGGGSIRLPDGPMGPE